jgi:hypothetical protein
MNPKKPLSLDALRVETFETGRGGPGAAGVASHSLDTLCDTDYDSLCPCCSIDAGCGAA